MKCYSEKNYFLCSIFGRAFSTSSSSCNTLCIAACTEGQPTVVQSAVWGSIAPAAWSFMLAARSFGLGTSWTSLHLFYEEESANILNIPYKDVMQAALILLAYTIGTDFKPAPRNSVHTIVHLEYLVVEVIVAVVEVKGQDAHGYIL
jgi:nitroreductase